MSGSLALGAVFLTVTGAEALYADMGHFGRKPIQTAWLAFVLPSLAINYLGQGALLLNHPEKLENPFFLLYPGWALLPMVALATAATIIASQAVITGAFSLTQQAIQLGLLPRMEIRRTSETEKGQIYIPRVNWLLLIAVVYLVIVFRSSSAFASAYGIAVTGTMAITTAMAFLVLWKCWRWRPATAALVIAPFLAIDLVFLMANMLKIVEGGWMPLAVGAALMTVMLTWRRGARILAEKARKDEVRLANFIVMLEKSTPERVKGVAVFLTGRARLDAERASAQSQAQQDPARDERDHERRNRGSAAHRGGAPRHARAALGLFRAGDAPVRLHGGAERAARACRVPGQGHGLRRDADFVLPVAPRLAAGAALGDAALAGPPVHLARPLGKRREPIFRHPERTRGRGRHADHSVEDMVASKSSA